MTKTISTLILLLLSTGLSSCISRFNTTNAPVPLFIKINEDELGGSAHFTVNAHGVGPAVFYSTSSFNSGGGEKLGNNVPTTEVAQAQSNDIKITIILDGFSGPTAKEKNIIDHLQRFSDRFTKALAEQRKITWNNSSKRKYDFRLYYIHSKYKIAQTTTRRLNGPTLHLDFYRSTSQGIAEKINADSLAHESYHLEVNKLISKITPNYKLEASSGLHNVLDEVSASLFGFCNVLRSEGSMDLERTPIFPIKQRNKQIRKGTMSDAHMRTVLQDKTRIKSKDISPYGKAIFLSLWNKYAGIDEEIKREDPAAEKFFELCANNIAHPHDIWPILWELANDGRDSDEFMTSAERAKKRAEEKAKRKAAGS